MNTDRDDTLALALGLLPDEQARALRDRLEADPVAQADFDADEAALAALVSDLNHEDVQVPVDAGAQLLGRVRAEAGGAAPVAGLPDTPHSAPASTAPRRLPRTASLPWGVPAALGMAAALALAFVLRAPADLPTRYAQVPGAVQQAIEVPGRPLGTLTRLPDGRTYVHLTRPLEPGRTYQLWSLAGGQPLSLGVFGPDGLLSAPLPSGTTVAVTVEPPGGSVLPTTTPIFAQAL